jgi:hypothetical protein
VVTNLIVTSWTPNQNWSQLNKLWLKLRDRKLPASMKRIDTYAVPTEEGIRSYTIYEVDDAKVSEAIREIAQRQNIYSETQGYRWKLEIAMKATEIQVLVGSGALK